MPLFVGKFRQNSDARDPWSAMPRRERSHARAAPRIVLGALFVAFMLPEHAHAYLDANSGSLLLQVLIGGLAGLGVVIRLYWRRVRDFLSGLRNKP